MVRRSALPGYIVDVLKERYPEMVVPHGTWKVLAAEIGISRAYIGSVAARNGWVVEGHDQDRTRPLLAALRERFPDRELPHGTFVALAEEFGVSPQYVRQVAMQDGWVASRNRPKKPTPLCQCGRPVRTARAACP